MKPYFNCKNMLWSNINSRLPAEGLRRTNLQWVNTNMTNRIYTLILDRNQPDAHDAFDAEITFVVSHQDRKTYIDSAIIGKEFQSNQIGDEFQRVICDWELVLNEIQPFFHRL